MHKLEFRFGAPKDIPEMPVRFRCRLDGVDNDWREQGGAGMRFTVRFISATDDVLDVHDFVARGASDGWKGSLEKSGFTFRRETIDVPAGAVRVHLLLVSGGPVDTLGFMLIDDLHVRVKSPGSSSRDGDWLSYDFEEGENMDRPEGTPRGWTRDGLRRDILRIVKLGGNNHALAALDEQVRSFGEWTCRVPLGDRVKDGDTLTLEWKELFNIGNGKTLMVSYNYVQPGSYKLDVESMSPFGDKILGRASIPIQIPMPVTQQLWFILLCILSGGTAIGLMVRHLTRRRMLRQVERLEWQQGVERERARIARDIHDDLGSGLTRISMLGTMVRRQLDGAPKAAEGVDEILATSRKLVAAMDEIVWAVNPKHDTLDSLVSYLGKYAQDYLGPTGIRCRLDLPFELSDWVLTSPVRHSIFLAFKEALNNAVKHSGAGEIGISAEVKPDHFTLTIRDNGRGFDPASVSGDRNGLANMRKRLEEIHGECVIQSSKGQGSVISFVVRRSHS
jgi:signal transduction histidine kinase